ncbi:MAG: BrnA antitoxin family protein [Burkholderiaceae bacterium]|jgi:uncharacterized protein (DUF4415 family)|nr:BrnA antitoxin family protein [Burkholderiaceae bacterium]
MSIVRYKQGEIPPITQERRVELRALTMRPDSEIDYSDIPPLTEEFWARAVPNPFYRPAKTQTSVRIDADVLVWLRSQGKGWQTRMNAALREAMLQSRRVAIQSSGQDETASDPASKPTPKRRAGVAA